MTNDKGMEIERERKLATKMNVMLQNSMLNSGRMKGVQKVDFYATSFLYNTQRLCTRKCMPVYDLHGKDS